MCASSLTNLKPLEDAAIPGEFLRSAFVRWTTADKPDTLSLLADAVGLGKTIEAGLIMRELNLHTRNGYDEVKSWSVEIGNKANVEVSHV